LRYRRQKQRRQDAKGAKKAKSKAVASLVSSSAAVLLSSRA
jgi:hypothetical protein